MNKQVLGWLHGLGPYRLKLQGVPNYSPAARLSPYAACIANDNHHLCIGYGGDFAPGDAPELYARQLATLTREQLGLGPPPHYSRR